MIYLYTKTAEARGRFDGRTGRGADSRGTNTPSEEGLGGEPVKKPSEGL